MPFDAQHWVLSTPSETKSNQPYWATIKSYKNWEIHNFSHVTCLNNNNNTILVVTGHSWRRAAINYAVQCQNIIEISEFKLIKIDTDIPATHATRLLAWTMQRDGTVGKLASSESYEQSLRQTGLNTSLIQQPRKHRRHSQWATNNSTGWMQVLAKNNKHT